MNYKIVVTRNFEKQLKRLAKKFPSIKNDIIIFESSLKKDPKQGIPLGKNSYKIRFTVKSKAKGKRGGFRIITFLEIDFVIKDLTNVFLLTIYDKSETDTITNTELRRLIESITN